VLSFLFLNNTNMRTFSWWQAKTVAPALGKFKSSSGSQACSQCDAGKFVSGTASVSLDNCLSCGMDTYSSSDMIVCVACPSDTTSSA